MLQKMQETKFLILPNTFQNKKQMIKGFLFHPQMKRKLFYAYLHNSNKSSGSYIIPIKILQLVKTDIDKPLSDIMNLSFSTGQFPSKLKTTKVIPL